VLHAEKEVSSGGEDRPYFAARCLNGALDDKCVLVFTDAKIHSNYTSFLNASRSLFGLIQSVSSILTENMHEKKRIHYFTGISK
jgi:hypothetical protein